jgi:hypothetical protein
VEKHQLHEEDDTTRLYVFKSIPERAEVSYRPGVLGQCVVSKPRSGYTTTAGPAGVRDRLIEGVGIGL